MHHTDHAENLWWCITTCFKCCCICSIQNKCRSFVQYDKELISRLLAGIQFDLSWNKLLFQGLYVMQACNKHTQPQVISSLTLNAVSQCGSFHQGSSRLDNQPRLVCNMYFIFMAFFGGGQAWFEPCWGLGKYLSLEMLQYYTNISIPTF